MHGRLIKFHVKFGKSDEFLRLYQEQVIPALQGQAGFAEISIGLNEDHGRAVSLVMFESLEDLIATERDGWLAAQVSKAMPLLDYPPQIEHYTMSIRV
ncbi:MAG: hypothetical protein ABF335_01010 [Alphaproteobacteria bacterium]